MSGEPERVADTPIERIAGMPECFLEACRSHAVVSLGQAALLYRRLCVEKELRLQFAIADADLIRLAELLPGDVTVGWAAPSPYAQIPPGLVIPQRLPAAPGGQADENDRLRSENSPGEPPR